MLQIGLRDDQTANTAHAEVGCIVTNIVGRDELLDKARAALPAQILFMPVAHNSTGTCAYALDSQCGPLARSRKVEEKQRGQVRSVQGAMIDRRRCFLKKKPDPPRMRGEVSSQARQKKKLPKTGENPGERCGEDAEAAAYLDELQHKKEQKQDQRLDCVEAQRPGRHVKWSSRCSSSFCG